MTTSERIAAINDKHHRYFIDERGGCIAVRDRLNTDPEYNGLHEDTYGVVWYRHGWQKIGRCPTCGGTQPSEWMIHEEDRDLAVAECNRLNALVTQP